MVTAAELATKTDEAVRVEITHKPCRVTEVELKGLNKTRSDVIGRELEGVRQATTLSEVYSELQDFVVGVVDYDAFSGVDIFITQTKRGDPDKCRLEIKFTEKTPWMARAKTFIQGGSEAGVEGRVGLRNLRGCGEKLNLFVEYGSHNLRESALEYFKPRIGGHPLNFQAKLFHFTKSHFHFTSCEERLKGMGLTLSSSDHSQTLSYDLGWHQLSDSHHWASTPVQDQLGHQLKSSIRYESVFDKREARQLSSGAALRTISELIGLWPNAAITKFFKQRLDSQLSWRFSPWGSISIGAGTGVMFPLSTDFKSKSSNIMDRFYLGGIDSVKGFHQNCIGPSAACRPNHEARRRERDFLGGEVMASAYASLNLFQPGTSEMGLYAHVFSDIGSVAPLSSFLNGSLRESARRFGKDYRASAGLGIVLPTALGNFEIWPTNVVWIRDIYCLNRRRLNLPAFICQRVRESSSPPSLNHHPNLPMSLHRKAKTAQKHLN